MYSLRENHPQLTAIDWMHNEVGWPEWCVRSYWESSTLVVLNIVSHNAYLVSESGAIHVVTGEQNFENLRTAYSERYPDSL